MTDDEGIEEPTKVFHVQLFTGDNVNNLTDAINRYLDNFGFTVVDDVRIALAQSEDEFSMGITAAVTVVTLEFFGE